MKKHWGFIKPHSHPNGFYWGHQCTWTLTPAIEEKDCYVKIYSKPNLMINNMKWNTIARKIVFHNHNYKQKLKL